MKRFSLALFPCLLAVLLAGLFLHPTFAHGATASTTTGGKGQSAVSSPGTPGPNNNPGVLTDIAAISANDVWAVGPTTIEHWNGTAWSIVPNTGGGSLSRVSAVATNDVWGLGGSTIEHWNGTVWSNVAHPQPRGSELQDVVAISSTDAWAVGWTQKYGTSLLEHWNGTTWSRVTGPTFRGDLYPDAVAAASANDVWAVGDSYEDHQGGTLLEHWNGTRWSMNNGFGALFSTLYGITVASATDVWVFGTNGTSETPLIGHWNGTTWSRVKSPAGYFLNGMAAISPTDAWAVGSSGNNPAIEHWNGSSWSVVPGGLTNAGQLLAVSAVSATDVWTVGGAYTVNNGSATLIEHWNGTTWSVVPGATEPDGELNGVTEVLGTSGFGAVSTTSADDQAGKTLTKFYC